MPPDNKKQWWKGSRGEWLVVIQVVLMVLVFFGPRTMPGQLETPMLPGACRIVGWPLMIFGCAIFLAGFVRFRANPHEETEPCPIDTVNFPAIIGQVTVI